MNNVIISGTGLTLLFRNIINMQVQMFLLLVKMLSFLSVLKYF